MATDLTTLLKRTQITDHDEILKTANNILKQKKNDPDAQHAKIVALLNLDRFDDAVHVFESSDKDLKEKARLEWAYALYKTGRAREAIDVARVADGEAGRGYKHVEAQAAYRTEDFARSVELYRGLVANAEGDAEADLRINSSAVDALLEWNLRGELVDVGRKKVGRGDLEAFESAYNAACCCLARGELAQGEMLLKRARALCEGAEELSGEKKRAEVVPILGQMVYVLLRLGRREEAGRIAREIESMGEEVVVDLNTRQIVQVNGMVAGEAQRNPYLAQRVLGHGGETMAKEKPFAFQEAVLKQNRYALELQMGKFDGLAGSVALILSKETAPTLDAYYNHLSVFNAAARAKAQTGKEALKHMLPAMEKRPKDVGLLLTIAQLFVMTGDSSTATTMLEKFLELLEQTGSATELDVRFAPGLIGIMVSLYQSAGRRGSALNELAKAAQHWRRKMQEDSIAMSMGVVNLLKAAGSLMLESEEAEHAELAAELFKDLYERDDSDKYAAAGMLAASPQTATNEQSQSLQSIDRLISTIDIDALENGGIAQPTATTVAVTRKRPAASNDTPKPAKRPRKARLPKDYDPDKRPDPERWLPLRDRSTYRPKGKKGKARREALSQGAVAQGSAAENARPATPSAGVVQGKGSGGGGGGANKKKKGKR
ncbi:hypothetical protein LTR62_007813 [Meristemomyces frigidus]|uniref:Signal recognition particle subunit SRP72 n=1 Tax=Meristemomyces frigidus TaxID=1508187 RepID=A0AAN7YD83_9PEZI|nr:hypothetical protein LTR62_007813 [Meristemomyces frigidus]